jgi:hypothetical protein
MIALTAVLAACGSSSSDDSASEPGGATGTSGSPGSGGGSAGMMIVGGDGGASTTAGSGGGLASAGGANAGGANAGGAMGGGGSASSGAAGKGGGSGGAGGSAGMGGSGGAGGSPMTKASACNGLPAAGTWDNVAPPGVTDTNAVMVDPFDAAIVWLGANNKGVFKSTDCGATWKHVNTGRHGADLDKGGLVSMAADPVAQGVLYTIAIYGAQGMWKSTNGGVDWDPLFPADSEVAKTVQYNFIDSISMDPTNHQHLVIGTHADCAAPYNPTCEAESNDGGATWRLFKQPGSGWQEQAGPFILDASSWVYGAPAGLFLTTDHGATWKDVTPSGASFGGGEVENHEIHRGRDGTYYLTTYSGIAKSADGHTWSLIPNSGGRSVGFASCNGQLYSSDQWGSGYHTASDADNTKWSVVPPPPAPGNMGAPFIDCDAAHHLLYSSNFAGGLWRLVLP